jgi:hypothetical protein
MKLKHEFNPELRKQIITLSKEQKIIKLLNEKEKFINSKYFHNCSKSKQVQIKNESKTVPLWAWL